MHSTTDSMHHIGAHPSARLLRAAAVALTVPLLLVACSSQGSDSARSADAVTIDNQWVKAADSGMSAAFGDLRNDSDRDRRVVAGSSPASSRIELHEVVAGTDGATMMRPKQGGFVVPAHGSIALRPGGDHIMFMDLTAPLRTGAQTSVTLTFEDGSTSAFTAQVRDFAGNQENYSPEHTGETGTGASAPAHSG